jgi:L-asparaginase II
VTEPVVLARVTRSGVQESVHLGHVAVCDADGRLVANAGDPQRVLFPRSSMKPLQAAVSAEASGGPHGEAELAIMCASHNGEPVHVDAVRGVLALADLGEDSLRCPPAWPWWPEDAAGLDGPSPILHNCSGKHAGMLVASAGQGWDLDGYLDPTHPLQQRILRAVERFTGAPAPALGVDGCGAPVYSLPLSGIATMFARFVSPRGLELGGGEIRAVVRAMRSTPYLVAGRNRVDTTLMENIEGLVVKSGAEGLICAAHAERGIGVAVRIDDGAARAAGPALVRTLELLEIVHSGNMGGIESIARPPVLGGGRPVGALTSDFVLSPG